MPVITPVTTTSASANTQPSAPAQDARSRAIAMLSGQPSQATPVADPNNVSPEEMGALNVKKDEEEGQNNTVEAAQEETPAEVKPKEDPLSAQYAQLARKEKALRAQAQQVKAKEAALAAREAALLAPKPAAQAPAEQGISRQRLLEDPMGVFQELGMSYDQITQAALNAPSPETLAQKQMFQEMKTQIAELKAELEDGKKSQVSQTQNQYNQALAQLKSEAKQLVYSSDDYETIRATNSVNEVVDLIEQTFKADGVMLSVEEAAKAVEEYIVEEALKVAKLKKIQTRLQPAPAQPVAKKTEQPEQSQEQPIKTLTNAVGTQRKLSSRDRALLAFKGEKF